MDDLRLPGERWTSANDISGNIIVGDYISDVSRAFVYDGTNWTTLYFPGATRSGLGIGGNRIVGSYQDVPELMALYIQFPTRFCFADWHGFHCSLV